MELQNIEIQDEKVDEAAPEDTHENEEEEVSDSESNVSSDSAESVFTPPDDLPNEKSIWRADLPLPLCIFTNIESNGCTTVTTDDELLEHALGHLDESLSPIFVLDAADQHDYTMLIPYETAYRSPAREVSLRASRDGLKWIRIPTQITDHETHEDVKFARVSTRRYSYVTLVYRNKGHHLCLFDFLLVHSCVDPLGQYPHEPARSPVKGRHDEVSIRQSNLFPIPAENIETQAGIEHESNAHLI